MAPNLFVTCNYNITYHVLVNVSCKRFRQLLLQLPNILSFLNVIYFDTIWYIIPVINTNVIRNCICDGSH